VGYSHIIKEDMALTNAQFQAWLEDPTAIRCMLVEVSANISGTETNLYLSNIQYVTGASDSPSNTTYLPLLKTAVNFTENLSLNGAGSLSYGDISIDNTNGEYDNWLKAAWQGRAISIYIGDPKFVRADFTKIFSGIVADVNSSDKDTINLQLRDIMQKLNTPITDKVLGNYYQGSIVSTAVYDNPNKEQVKPLVFGEVFNITPLLIDPTTLEFMVNDGPIESIIEVRDNGVPLIISSGYTVDLVKGTFKLLKNPAGAITCSVQGDKNPTYNNTVSNIIKRIIKSFGNPSIAGTITDADIDLTNFNTFQTNHPQAVGIYISAKDNLISVCQELAASVGAQLVASRSGLLRLLKVTIPVAGTETITDDYIIQNSLAVSQKPEIMATSKLGFCKNWTVQDNLLTGIPSAHKDLMSGEWLSKTYTNTTAQALYKLDALPEQKNTLMLTDASGQVTAEATRLVNLWSTPRYVYRFIATSKFLQLQLGDMVTVKHKRFGLTSGVYAQIISIEIDWDIGFITLEVLI
jgi:hypothetical protein